MPPSRRSLAPAESSSSAPLDRPSARARKPPTAFASSEPLRPPAPVSIPTSYTPEYDAGARAAGNRRRAGQASGRGSGSGSSSAKGKGKAKDELVVVYNDDEKDQLLYEVGLPSSPVVPQLTLPRSSRNCSLTPAVGPRRRPPSAARRGRRALPRLGQRGDREARALLERIRRAGRGRRCADRAGAARGGPGASEARWGDTPYRADVVTRPRAQGIVSIESLMVAHSDEALDKFVSWALRNTFRVPDGQQYTLVSSAAQRALSRHGATDASIVRRYVTALAELARLCARDLHPDDGRERGGARQARGAAEPGRGCASYSPVCAMLAVRC